MVQAGPVPASQLCPVSQLSGRSHRGQRSRVKWLGKRAIRCLEKPETRVFRLAAQLVLNAAQFRGERPGDLPWFIDPPPL
ncbi:hypothetical protein SKAU_G00089410 [Synaphobranchus kaupii]|uniref:Uncharacterized protein n=1 Tax=Synaphobranchus kaupii TaxID=118154 RepID=A0A9Q1J6C3_SYNKA|nr:hypothetical protein SKAU_G00089410 [Synaphobranchus kaupii]